MNLKRIVYLFIALFLLLNYCQVSALNIQDKQKNVYLTFDDGPDNKITEQILEILEKNNIKATFFVIGERAINNASIIKEEANKGMAIYPHTFSHKYKEIYSSKESYITDLKECINSLNNIRGEKKALFTRMPGGKDNNFLTKEVYGEIVKGLKEEEIFAIDWTVSIEGNCLGEQTEKELLENLNEYGGMYSVEVVLMHDLVGKDALVNTLQDIIDFYRERNYNFKTLDSIEPWEIEYLREKNIIV